MFPETIEHIKFCRYIKENHPGVIFVTDFYEKMSKSARIQFRDMRSGNNPDIFIANNGGLFIEMKHSKSKRSGSHYLAQKEEMEALKEMGYPCFLHSDARKQYKY